MSEEKFVGYFRLLEACDKPGCPVCRSLVDESHGYLDALLYEQVTDPETRRALRASWGFCHRHTWMLLEVEQSLFGASIIYEDLVGLVLRATEPLDDGRSAPGPARWLAALRRRPRPAAVVERYRGRAACPACVHGADTERRYVDTLVRFLDEGDLQAAYARPDGLCLPHLVAAVEQHPAGTGTRTLVQRTREKWARIGRDIASFVGKHDYRNREPFTPAEVASYRRAFELLVGARHVVGSARDGR